MTDTRLNHSQAMLVAIINRQLVIYRTTRLNNSSNTCFISYFNTVREREKCIRSHNGTFQIEFESVCLFNGLFQRIHARCLTDTACAKLFVLDRKSVV